MNRFIIRVIGVLEVIAVLTVVVSSVVLEVIAVFKSKMVKEKINSI